MKELKVVSITDAAAHECGFSFCLGDRVQLKSRAKVSGVIRDGQCEITEQLRRVIYLVSSDFGFFYFALEDELQAEGG
jgi:hypothetical protein